MNSRQKEIGPHKEAPTQLKEIKKNNNCNELKHISATEYRNAMEKWKGGNCPWLKV